MNSIIEDSKYWENLNKIYLDKKRYEGCLKHNKYNKKVLNSIKKYNNIYESIENSYLVGLELEFYIKPEVIENLICDLMLCIPQEYMLIEDLDKVLVSDKKHFFLIKEQTGGVKDGYISVELISPILSFRVIPYYLKTFFKLLNKFKVKTTKKSGLHIHLSTTSKKQVSPIVLLYFIDKNKAFKWKEREFVKNIIKEIFSYRSSDWQYIYEHVLRKCYSINFCNFNKNNHIEYRSPGGKKYYKKYEKIINCFFSILKSYESTLLFNDDEELISLNETYIPKRKVISTKNLSYHEFINLDTNDLWII